MQSTFRVQFGSLEHLLPISVAVVFCLALFKFVNKKEDALKHKVFNALGLIVSGFMIVFHLYQISKGGYSLQTDLPLYLCSFMALFIFIFTVTRRFWLFEVLLFWIIVGTTQGVITPDIEKGFPAFDYFRYWVVHLGLLIIITYAILVLKMKPNIRSVIRSFVTLQVYLIALMLINLMLDANYSYLNEKPVSGSILDYFGDWPSYVITVQLILIPAFLLIYLPFYLNRKRVSKH